MDPLIRSLKRHLAWLTVAALIGACTLVSPRQTPPTPPSSSSLPPPPPPPAASQPPLQPAPPAARAPPPARHIGLLAASSALVKLAHTQAAQGDYPAASSTLDRALRIEPNNALLWIELGRIRLAEGDAHQAESCGRKALALATGDAAVHEQAGRLVADAQQAGRHAP